MPNVPFPLPGNTLTLSPHPDNEIEPPVAVHVSCGQRFGSAAGLRGVERAVAATAQEDKAGRAAGNRRVRHEVDPTVASEIARNHLPDDGRDLRDRERRARCRARLAAWMQRERQRDERDGNGGGHVGTMQGSWP